MFGIDDEMEEKAYQRGLRAGIFWPLTLLKAGAVLAGVLVSEAQRKWRNRHRTEPKPEPVTPPPFMPGRGMSYRELQRIEVTNLTSGE